MSTGDVTVIAHRGASGYAPEHTIAAFDLALELGADRLELDIRPLADGTLAVVHDATLARTCGDPRAVAELRLADLLALDPATRPLPLADVLVRYGAATRFLLELKDPTDADAQALLALVDRLALRDRVTIQSFDHRPLRRLHALAPQVPLQALYRRRTTAARVRLDLPRVAAWAGAIAPCASAVDAPLVAAAHARGLRVEAYTVNDEPEMRRLLALGVDGLITDVPDRVRSAVGLPLAA